MTLTLTRTIHKEKGICPRFLLHVNPFSTSLENVLELCLKSFLFTFSSSLIKHLQGRQRSWMLKGIDPLKRKVFGLHVNPSSTSFSRARERECPWANSLWIRVLRVLWNRPMGWRWWSQNSSPDIYPRSCPVAGFRWTRLYATWWHELYSVPGNCPTSIWSLFCCCKTAAWTHLHWPWYWPIKIRQFARKSCFDFQTYSQPTKTRHHSRRWDHH